MRELGALADAGHDEVGRAAGASGAAGVFAVGGGAAPRIAARAAEGGVRAVHAGAGRRAWPRWCGSPRAPATSCW